MKKLGKFAVYLGVAVFCAFLNMLVPTFVPQLILYLLLVWRLEDKAGL